MKDPLPAFGASMLLIVVAISIASQGIKINNCERSLLWTNETYRYGNNYTGNHFDYILQPQPPITTLNLFHRETKHSYEFTCDDPLFIRSGYTTWGGIMMVFLALGIAFLFAVKDRRSY